MQQEAFVLQHTDTCFSQVDIIAILPLFSIGAASISVAALSELSEAPADSGLLCIWGFVKHLHKTQPRTNDHTTGWAQRLRPPPCHHTDLTSNSNLSTGTAHCWWLTPTNWFLQCLQCQLSTSMMLRENKKKKWKKKRKQELEPETCNGGDSEASGSLTMTHRTTFISNKKKSHNMFSWLIVKNEKWISQQANRCLEFWFLKVWDRKECFEGRGNISMGEIGAGNLPLEWRRQPCFIMEEIQCDMLRMNCSVNQKYPLF